MELGQNKQEAREMSRHMEVQHMLLKMYLMFWIL